MNSIPIFGVLVLNRGDLLLRLFESIDYPVDEFIIINNGKAKDVREAIEKIVDMFPGKVRVRTPEKNTGVAPGWNWIFTNFDKPWYFIAGNDVMFTPGDLEKMATVAWEKHEVVGKVFGNQGHNAHITTKLALEKVGLYDENFYPAYLEDCDYMWRCKLTGVERAETPGCNIIHGEAPLWGSSTIHSNNEYRILNGITHGNGFKYYHHKWGGNNDAEVYEHPYNNPEMGPKDWIFYPELREMNDIWGV